jgi:hypothetical protein
MCPEAATPLVAAAKRRHELTRARAIQAIRELDRAGTAVTFTAVAGQARVSRSWLYSQPDICRQIRQLREATGRSTTAPIPRASVPPTPRCYAGWRPPTPKTAGCRVNAPSSGQRSRGCAGRSPTSSVNSAKPAPTPATRRQNPRATPFDNDQARKPGPRRTAAATSRSPSTTGKPRSQP